MDKCTAFYEQIRATGSVKVKNNFLTLEGLKFFSTFEDGRRQLTSVDIS